jgi:hypothetical protein
MRTLAGWCVNHRRTVFIAWANASLGLMKSAGATRFTDQFFYGDVI